MLELYQFELCPYSEKVRLILDYKGLEYKKIEVTPGVGQIEVFRLSGQRQVPVLKDGDMTIADSTEIAFYLDRKYPDRPLIPTDPLLRGQCLIMEEWADESIAVKSRKAFIGALNQNQNFRTSILPKNTPDIFKNLIGAVPGDLLNLLGTGVGLGGDVLKEARRGLKQDLEALNLILESQPYLISDQPTLADLTVAALSMMIKCPEGYINFPEELKGKSIPGLGDNSAYETFFNWRDRLYADFRQPLTNTGSSDSKPTSINIE